MEAHVPFFPIRTISIHHHCHRPPPPSSLPSPRRWLVAFTTPLSLQKGKCFTGEAATDASGVKVDELLEIYQDHAKEKGFAVVIRSSTKDEDGQLKYVWLSCDRGRNTYFEKHSKRLIAPIRFVRLYEKVQGEINGMMYCHLDPNNENDTSSIPGVEKFNIKECSIKNWYCKEFSYTVEYRANGQYFDCNCRKFESGGLVCRHIFEVMKMKGIARVHERYIMRRWRKDVLRRHLSIVHSGGYLQMTDEYKKFKEIEHALHEAVDLYTNNPVRLGFHPNHVTIRDLNYVRCRGREELEEIIVKGKAEAKAIKAKVKANQLT
ncbi:hypothetical protein Scep_024052 [Stephania cephalantha]|uniref:SWIM-type domain-containing protein n=1 Tax=Stephania cephalantha TaxID=152367 RepID=A0AAP0F190_9MAGN